MHDRMKYRVGSRGLFIRRSKEYLHVFMRINPAQIQGKSHAAYAYARIEAVHVLLYIQTIAYPHSLYADAYVNAARANARAYAAYAYAECARVCIVCIFSIRVFSCVHSYLHTHKSIGVIDPTYASAMFQNICIFARV